MDFYFFKTVSEKGRNRLRPLTGQKLSGIAVDTSLNVQSDKVIRSMYPIGTTFGSAKLELSSGFYIAGDIYPMGLLDTDYKMDEHRPPEAMQRAYETFIGATEEETFRKEEEVEETAKDSLYDKMKRNKDFVVPKIDKGGFYVDPDNWYLLLRNIQNQVNTMMIGPTGTGKCLGKDTPVLMYDGTIKMVQDIQVGDKLMGPDSTPRNVLSTTTGREELFKVIPKKGDSWVCNKSHILSLKRTNDGTSKGGTICNVSIEEYLTWSKTHKHIYKQWRVPIEFKEIEVYLDPYFLGLWLGDGRTDSPVVCTADRTIVHYLRDYAWQLGCTLSIYKEPSKANSYGIVQKGRDVKYRTTIQTRMDEYDLLGNKHIPNDFLYNSRENRLRLFAGLMDSDGSNSGNYYEFTTKLSNLKDEVIYLGRSLGYFVSCKETIIGGSTYWRLMFSGDFSDVPVRISRKKCSCRKQKKDVLVTGIFVESIGEGDYYGFTIDGDHLFCLGDFTVTHNTELVMLACERLGIPCHVYDMGSMYDPVAGLLGVHRLQKGGVSTFDYAKFTQDISEPGVVLLDELSRAPVTTNNILFPCLDSRRMLPVEIAGGEDLRAVKVHPDCCFIATANVGAEYTGTMSMDRALVGRFFPLELDYMPKDKEEQVLMKRCKISATAAKHIVSVANNVRDMYRKQELSCSLSTRETLMVSELVADGWSTLRAMELVFLPLFEGTKADGERGIIAKTLLTR